MKDKMLVLMLATTGLCAQVPAISNGTFPTFRTDLNTSLGLAAPVASPTFTGTVTLPATWKIGSTTVSSTGTELNYVSGVTSALQTQLNLLAPKASPTFTGTVTHPTPFTLGAVSVTTTGTELNYVAGVSSAIQTQINTKAPTASPTFTGTVTAPLVASTTNCSDSAGAAACGAAPAGSFVIDAASTATVVSTTAVTANSQIFLQEDSSLGTRLGITCNTQSVLILGAPVITARTAGTSFTATIVVGPTAVPMCVSYFLVN